MIFGSGVRETFGPPTDPTRRAEDKIVSVSNFTLCLVRLDQQQSLQAMEEKLWLLLLGYLVSEVSHLSGIKISIMPNELSERY